MGKRRKARETAMSFLYQAAMRKDFETQPAKDFWQEAGVEDDTKAFTEKIIAPALQHRQEIDDWIQKVALHWKIDRIAAVDLAILRMAIAEMLYGPGTPAVVVIDEAVEIAKKYSTLDSGGFVNGLLDKIKKEAVDKDASRKD